MAKIHLTYVDWREGRPRFSPGPREKALGFKSKVLRHGDAGPWYTLDEARAFSAAVTEEIKQARETGKRAAASAARGTSVADLLADWIASDDFADNPRSTQNWYRKIVDAICFKPRSVQARRAGRELQGEPFARAPAAVIGPPEVKAFFEYQRKARGHHTAKAAVAALSAAYTFGRMSTRWRLPTNPCHRLRLPKPPARVIIWTVEEIRALIAAADHMGLHSIGDSVMLAVFTGQRQGDRINLSDNGLVAGRRRFKQRKTGAIVDVREAPPLQKRLAEARVRISALMLKHGLQERPDTLIVHEATGRAYAESTYQNKFREVRAAAIAGIRDDAATAAAAARGQNEPAWIVEPCTSLTWTDNAGEACYKRDQDFRDTAVTWLANYSATHLEIAAVTGHSPKSIHNILQHYLAMSPELADNAIAKMVAGMEAEGLTV